MHATHQIHRPKNLIQDHIGPKNSKNHKRRLLIQLGEVALNIGIDIRLSLEMRHDSGALREQLRIRQRTPNKPFQRIYLGRGTRDVRALGGLAGNGFVWPDFEEVVVVVCEREDGVCASKGVLKACLVVGVCFDDFDALVTQGRCLGAACVAG